MYLNGGKLVCKVIKRIGSVFYRGLIICGMLILLAGCGGNGDVSGSAGAAKPSSVVPTANSAAGSASRSAANATAKQATLSWRAPVTRVNGDALSRDNLSSYEIRYGMSAENLNRSAVFDGAEGLIDMSYTIENLSAGTWYFTIRARDDNGLLSCPLDVGSKNIPS
jgi:hypothetical protein